MTEDELKQYEKFLEDIWASNMTYQAKGFWLDKMAGLLSGQAKVELTYNIKVRKP